jgi:ATP-dependent RNA helicase RhlE
VQSAAIPLILKGGDLLATAQTGSGKTMAYVLPLLQRWLTARHETPRRVHTLILVPTRELAAQVTQEVLRCSVHLPERIKVVSAFGGVSINPQMMALRGGADFVVATPGRLLDLVEHNALHLNHLVSLVLDEADLMLDLGFMKDIQDVLKYIPRKRQTLFFTATLNKKIKSLAYDVVKEAIRIQISPKNPVARNVDHAVAFIEMDDKRFFLENILKEYEEKKFIVFARTKVRVERVVAAMERVGIKTEALHGGIDQKERFAILDRFRSGENRVLITTDIAARGIDIPTMDYVINYDLPDDPENYVHRCGRTGRGTNKGQALSFCSQGERDLLTAIEEYTGEEIEHYEIDREDYDSILNDSDDPTYDWKKLIDKVNKEDGKEDVW